MGENFTIILKKVFLYTMVLFLVYLFEKKKGWIPNIDLDQAWPTQIAPRATHKWEHV